MAMNQVQFQPGLSMVAFSIPYGTEAKRRQVVFRARWLQGCRCPSCTRRVHSRFRRESQIYHQCCACRRQTTLLAGTLFEATRLPLRTWFLRIHLLISNKTNMAALELKRHLHVIYRTPLASEAHGHGGHDATRSTAPIRRFRAGRRRLSRLRTQRRQTGRGSENKQAFMVAAAADVTDAVTFASCHDRRQTLP